MSLTTFQAWVRPYRPAVRASARWLVDLLDLKPTDDVLDVSPAGGYSTALIGARLATGRVVVVDPLRPTLAVTHFHVRRQVRAGRVSLVRAELRSLPRFDIAFDKVLISDIGRLSDELALVLGVLAHRMIPGGRIALATQVKEPGQAQAAGAKLAQALSDARFAEVETRLHLPTACALGRRPG